VSFDFQLHAHNNFLKFFSGTGIHIF